MKERNVLLDFLKGFAIVLVVLGHSIQYNLIETFDSNPIFRIIYSFHMPLFMFISGFVSYKTFDGSIQKLEKRFKSLIIPFWAWFLFSFFFSYLMFLLKESGAPDFISSLKLVLKSPNYGGLWFLWILFLNYLVLFFCQRISSRREEIFMFLFFIGLNGFLHFTGIDYLGAGLLSWYLPFYILGYAIHKYKPGIGELLKVSGIVSFFLFPVLVSFWSRTGHPTFYNQLSINPMMVSAVWCIYKFMVPITGILAIYVFFEWLIQYDFWFKKSFIALGKVSLEIYATHFYFINIISLIGFLPLGFRIAVTFLFALIGSLIIQSLLKKVGFLAVVFYGKPAMKTIL